MSKRLEAGTKALWVRNHDLPFEAMQEGHKRPYRREAEAVLSAADEVMFSEEAIERAARAEYESDMENLPGGFTQPWDEVGETQEHYRRGVRAVIASLKGEPSV